MTIFCIWIIFFISCLHITCMIDTDENKASVFSLDEPLADYTNKEIGEFVSHD
jgi:hypothetical protein